MQAWSIIIGELPSSEIRCVGSVIGRKMLMLFPLLAILGLVIAVQANAQPVKRTPLYGYVDRCGDIVEPATWEAGSTIFTGNWIAVKRSGKAGYLNLKTRATTGLIFYDVKDGRFYQEMFEFGPQPALIEGQWGYVTQTGDKDSSQIRRCLDHSTKMALPSSKFAIRPCSASLQE